MEGKNFFFASGEHVHRQTPRGTNRAPHVLPWLSCVSFLEVIIEKKMVTV